jgi:hypothetical protein
MKKPTSLLICVALLSLMACGAMADEGMWLLNRLDKLPWDSLRSMGMELTPTDVYNPNGPSLTDAIAGVGGASGSFVSADGLIITNHHVAFGAIQRQSTPEHNYIRDGFRARTREEELPALGYTIFVLRSIEDVTSDITKHLNAKQTPRQRYRAIEKATKELVKKREYGKDVWCKVASLYDGAEYSLYTFFRIRDIRLVFAPADMIGAYGGEIDNWMWPRHDGDFSFLRAYVAPDGSSANYSKDNVPYHPRQFLHIDASGAHDSEFVFAIGTPGTTDRYASSFALEKTVLDRYPEDIRRRKAMLAIIDSAAATDSSVAIRVESRIAGLSNYLKKNEGMLEGFHRADILSQKQENERHLTKFINADPNLVKKYGHLLPSLDSLYRVREQWQGKSSLLRWMMWQSDYLHAAYTIYKTALERQKKDIDRQRGYQDRDTLRTVANLRDMQVNLLPSVDLELLAYLCRESLNLPDTEQIAAVSAMLAAEPNATPHRAIDDYLAGLYHATKLGDEDERLAMYHMPLKQLLALDDPFIEMAKLIEPDEEVIRAEEESFNGAMTVYQPELIAAYRAWKGGEMYPDATGTTRLTYGSVKGYVPRDAVYYEWVTTLTGVFQKETGVDPFIVPRQLQDVYKAHDFGKYYDSTIGDVPVDFLSTLDITNGNSGSPIINGKGDLVGLAFDGNWESISSDYLFQPALTRCIGVDITYVLFILDKVYHADELLREMTIHWR